MPEETHGPGLEAGGPERTAVVLYSGGSDSTLAAIRTAMRFERVHLLAFTRRGVWGREPVAFQAGRLGRFFGDPGKFTLRVLRTDRLCRHVMYERYFHHLRRHGLLVASMCGLCKVSFHWRALIYCLEHGIRHVADGAVRVANVCPEQNEAILLQRWKGLYRGFGIEYENPVYEEGDQVEALLHEMRFNPTPVVKGTKLDRQMVCEQQVLYAMFLRVALRRWPFPEFERRMAAFYGEKLDMVEAWTREWATRRQGSRLAPLIES